MADAAKVRALALGLPGVSEQPYHGFPSFRVSGKVFANLPDDAHAHLMLEPEAIEAAAEADPDACEVKLWGGKPGALRIDLTAIAEADLAALLRDAWRRRAPKTLLDRLDG